MKYRIVRESPNKEIYSDYECWFYVQESKDDQWLGTSEWRFLSYADEEGAMNRKSFKTLSDAKREVRRLIQSAATTLEVVWTQP